MLDTIRFRISEQLPPELLEQWAFSCKPRKDGSMWFAYSNKFDGPLGTKIYIKYYPQDVHMNPIPLILVETSLPKLIFGNNVEMLKNGNEAVKILETFISGPLGRKVDINSAELDRIDLCYNHQVGNAVDPLIVAMFKLDYPKRKTKPFYPTNGVQFYSKAATLIFYDKEAESGNSKAKGILREEASFVNKFSVRRALGAKKPVFISDFTPEIVENILQRENEKLGLNETVFVDKSVALRALLSQYGSEQGMRLFGYLNAKDATTNEELINLGVPLRTLYRNKKSINQIGMWNALEDQSAMLPALSVNLTKCHGVVSCSSDT